MGNEESGVEIATPNANSPPPTALRQSRDHELLIVVRGTRRTGKTSLISMMQNAEFCEQYEATPQISACEVMWRSPENEDVNVTIWDVVEKGLMPVDAYEKQESADSTTVDTLKRADGLIIVIDKRFEDTSELAERIIRESKVDLPILVFSNFMDETNDPVIPQNLQNLMGRFYFVPGSVKRNQGLDKIFDWLQLPLMASKKKMFYNLYKKFEEDLAQKNIEFGATAEHFVILETAKEYVPVPKDAKQIIKVIPKEQNNPIPQNTLANNQSKQKIQENEPLKNEKQNTTSIVDDVKNNDYTQENNSINTPIVKINIVDNQSKQESVPRKYEKPYQRRKIKRTHVTQKKVENNNDNKKEIENNEDNKKKIIKKVRKANQPKQDENDFFNDDNDEHKIEKIEFLQKDEEILKPNPLVKPKSKPLKTIIKPIIKENKIDELNEVIENKDNNIKKNNQIEEKKKEESNTNIIPKQNIQIEELPQPQNNENKEEEELNDDDFWGDDDDNDNDDIQNINNNKSDSEEDEYLKPNPFVVKSGHSNLYKSIQAQEMKENVEEKKELPKPVNVVVEQDFVQKEISPEKQNDEENEYISI